MTVLDRPRAVCGKLDGEGKALAGEPFGDLQRAARGQAKAGRQDLVAGDERLQRQAVQPCYQDHGAGEGAENGAEQGAFRT